MTRDDRGFRALLGLGAIVSIALAFCGLAAPSILGSILGFDGGRRGATAFSGVGRLYGGAMAAIGVGYALAAVQPHRNRSLLVPLFVVPVAMLAATIAGMATDEIPGGRGAVFTAYNIAFALLYFRLYPRVGAEPPPSASTTTSTNASP